MSKPLVAFLNPVWWVLDEKDGTLRRGVRAGSRWPFTCPSSYTPDSFRIGEYMPYPVFLGSAAAWVARECPEVDVILRDSIARGESYDSFDKWWQSSAPDFVVMETGAAAAEHDLRIVRAMKRSNPNVKIALAGPPARELAAKYAGEPVDAWILGEYEKGATAFAKGASGVIPFQLLTKDELASAPYPLYDEEVATHYFDANPKGAKWPELQMWGSRGCFAVCNFCSFPATMTNDDPLGKGGRKIRFYSPEWIEGFIRQRIAVHAKTRFPLQSVRFDDDTANASNRHTKEICRVMRSIGLPWSMMCRADTSSRDVWQEMKDSGCFGVKIGFESGVDRIVNEVVGKKLDLKAAEETCRFLMGIGMSVHGTFMVGHPTETEAEKKQTIAFIRHLYATGAICSHQLSGTAVLDGTPLAHATITDPNFVRSADGQRKAEDVMRKAS